MDDVELISKELIENAIAPKAKKMSAAEHSELTQLLVQKDQELKGNFNRILYFRQWIKCKPYSSPQL